MTKQHDEDCERLPNFYLCHCEKRDRLARGITELPELVVPYPICGRCDIEVTHNGDTWECVNCNAVWREGAIDGDIAERFHDDYDGEHETLLEAREHWLTRKDQQ